MIVPAPVVSVLVTARDNAPHIAVTLASVLRQTRSDLELLVVDDGSRDATPEILSSLRDPRVNVTLHGASAGISVRRNELVDRARGRYIAPLDADDVWFPHRLSRHVSLLESRPELVGVGSDVMVVDEGAGIGPYFRLPRSDAAIRWQCLFTSPMIHTACLIRATAFAGGMRYDPAFPVAQDYDLFTKLLRRGAAVNLGVPLTLYRVHATQATRRYADSRLREQEVIGRRTIEEVGGVAGERARLAWCLGSGAEIQQHELGDAIDAYRELAARFLSRGRRSDGEREVARIAATALLRRAWSTRGGTRRALLRAAIGIDPAAPAAAALVRAANAAAGRRFRGPVRRLLAELASDAALMPERSTDAPT
jgi:hypothetical protein